MPSFADSIFLFVLALLLFGPKKLPVLARELGKWMGEFRRASNEFKMQMEEELRASEQADRQKQITAMEAAAPIPPALGEPAEPEHPHLRHSALAPEPLHSSASEGAAGVAAGVEGFTPEHRTVPADEPSFPAAGPAPLEPLDGIRPIPIATSGSLQMMPPATGLPTPRSRSGNPLGGLLESIPESAAPDATTPETAVHGD